jgi:hypothetical protein
MPHAQVSTDRRSGEAARLFRGLSSRAVRLGAGARRDDVRWILGDPVGFSAEASEAGAETEMSTVANAWAAFILALEEARDLHHRGADAHTIADLLQHARELLDIIDDEIADGTPQTVADARAVLAQLRGRLESLEQDVMPIRH